NAWRVDGVDGFFSHYLARDTVARAIAANAASMNTDDRTLIEFGFARALGAGASFSTDRILELAQKRGEHLPARMTVPINWDAVMMQRASDIASGVPPPKESAEYNARHLVAGAWDDSNLA